MSGKAARRGRLSEGGFTLVELLVYLIVAVIVVAGVYQL
ncbi:MAG: prepilin-type N-terminal cleavage/methylation domain-containing protein, partial [Gemmatimonadota bacterium]